MQPVQTKDYGKMFFAKIFYGASSRTKDGQVLARGGSLGILTDGDWVYFPSGHPIKSKEDAVEVLQEVNPAHIEEFLAWWEHRDELRELAATKVVRAIRVCPDDTLRYEDTDDEVTTVAALYEYYTPGSAALEMALQLFTAAQQRREKAMARQLLNKDREGAAPGLDQAFGRLRTGRQAPTSADEAKRNAAHETRMGNLQKAQQARQHKLAEKKAEQEKRRLVSVGGDRERDTDERA